MHLNCRPLLKKDDWSDWQHSKFLQLDQYFNQGCFGDPISVAKDNAVFYLVWTYTIKALDGPKKTRCICNGSSRLGLVEVLDEVYANCIDQTSSHIFYAIAAAKTFSSTVLTYAMHLRKPHPQSKASTSNPTMHSTNGGNGTRVDPPSCQAMSLQCFLQCKATQNPHTNGKSMPIQFSATSNSHLQSMNLAYTQVLLMVNV